MASSSSNADRFQQRRTLKAKTMAMPLESLIVQKELPVDFEALISHKIDMTAYISAQKLKDYFCILDGPVYDNLVKDFWVRAEVYNLESSKKEEQDAIARKASLKGKSRKEMGLKPYTGLEIRSSVMGIPVTITEEIVAKACRVQAEGKFQWNVNNKNPLLMAFNSCLLKGNPNTKLVDMEDHHRILLKIVTDCFFQRGGGSDQPNLDHKLVLYFLATYEKINLPRYLMHHLCWAIKEGITKQRKQIPCGRLLSEILYQGRVVELLKKTKTSSDICFERTTASKMINSKTLFYMKIISEATVSGRTANQANFKLIKDFPIIIQEDNPEIVWELIAKHAKESKAAEAQKQVIPTASEAAAPKKLKAPKASGAASPSLKRKRGKGETPSLILETIQMLEEDSEPPAKSSYQKLKKKIVDGKEVTILPSFEMTPELVKMAAERKEELMEERRRKVAELVAAKDAEIAATGAYDAFYEEKRDEVRQLANEAEKEAIIQIKRIERRKRKVRTATSEAAASGASGSDKVTQNPTTISFSESSSDSESDEETLIQRQTRMKQAKEILGNLTDKRTHILQELGELSQKRVDLCNTLPPDHPFQPPVIKPLQMIPADQPTPLSTTQTPQQTNPQENQPSASAEIVEDPEEPQTKDLPKVSSPSSLDALEKHLGGELQKTPQKPKSTQKPQILLEKPIQKPTQIPTPETTQSTPQTTQQEIPIETIPETETESAAEVQEPAESAPVSEPNIEQPDQLPLVAKTPRVPPPNLLDPEFVLSEFQRFGEEAVDLINSRDIASLPLSYDEDWSSLKSKAEELIEELRASCMKSKEEAMKRRLDEEHSTKQDSGSVLLLADVPFYPASEYVSKDSILINALQKQLRQSKEKQDVMLQRQLAMEETLRKQQEIIQKQSEEFQQMMALFKQQQQQQQLNPNP